MIEREIGPDHLGLEYHAECLGLYSAGNRKPLKDYDLRNEKLRAFLFFLFGVSLVACVGGTGGRKILRQNDLKAMRT